jgi:hypothetical protein
MKHVVSSDFRARTFHPEDLELLRDERRAALSRGLPFEIEQRPLNCNPNRFYRINMPTSHGSIRPIASSATAIQSGGRLPLPVPFTIAMISATNAQAKLIWGITKLSSFCKWYHALESLVLAL